MLVELIHLIMAAAKTTDDEKRRECQKSIRGMCHVVAVGGEDQRSKLNGGQNGKADRSKTWGGSGDC